MRAWARVTVVVCAVLALAAYGQVARADEVPGPDLAVSQVSVPSQGRFDIEVSNVGDATATEVVLNDELSLGGGIFGLSVTVSETGDCAEPTAAGFTCSFDDLAPGEDAQVSLSYGIDNPCEYSIYSTASASSTEDVDLSNNSAVASETTPGCTEVDICDIFPDDPECGGGGVECSPTLPTITPALDQDVAESELVTLTFTAVEDVSCTPTDYDGWIQTSGPPVTLSPVPGSFAATFTSPDVVGDQTLTFSFRVASGGLEAFDVVDVVVRDANSPPTALGDTYQTAEDTALTVTAPGVLGNDSDPNLDTLVAVLGTAPDHGDLVLADDGGFTYAPDADYAGADSFTYQARDPSGALSDAVTVDLTVTAVDDPATVTVARGTCPNANEAVLVVVLSDIDSNAAALPLTVTSSDPILSVRVVVGTGLSRTLRLTVSAPKSLRTATLLITAGTGSGAGSVAVPVFVGSEKADTIIGTSAADVLFGINGTDSLNAGGGNDLVCSGNGDGTAIGGAGNDTIDGGRGNDRLEGGLGNDTLLGALGNDRLLGGEGDDTLEGGAGADRFEGGPGDDLLLDAAKGDTIA